MSRCLFDPSTAVQRKLRRFVFSRNFISSGIVFLLASLILWTGLAAAHTPAEKAFYLQSRIVLKLKPNDTVAGNVVGVWRLEYNQLPESRSAFTTVLRNDPKNFLAAAGLALIEEQQERDKRALALAEQVPSPPVEFLPFLSLLRGRALLRLGKPGLAEAALRKGLQSADQSHGLWLWLGRVEEAKGNLDAAEQAYKKSIAADPFWLEPYSLLSLLYNRQGRGAEARKVMSEIVSLDNPSPYPNNDIQTLWRWAMRRDRK